MQKSPPRFDTHMPVKAATSTDRATDTWHWKAAIGENEKRRIDGVVSITKWVYLLTYLHVCLDRNGFDSNKEQHIYYSKAQASTVKRFIIHDHIRRIILICVLAMMQQQGSQAKV